MAPGAERCRLASFGLRVRQWRALKVRESKRTPQGSGRKAQGAGPGEGRPAACRRPTVGRPLAPWAFLHNPFGVGMEMHPTA